LRQTIGLKVIKLAATSFVRIPKTSVNKIVGGLATAQVKKKKTAHSLRARDDGITATLGSFACTNQKKKKWWYALGFLGPAASRREQCGISAENRNCKASTDDRC
jgi:hypothetical protein